MKAEVNTSQMAAVARLVRLILTPPSPRLTRVQAQADTSPGRRQDQALEATYPEGRAERGGAEAGRATPVVARCGSVVEVLEGHAHDAGNPQRQAPLRASPRSSALTVGDVRGGAPGVTRCSCKPFRHPCWAGTSTWPPNRLAGDGPRPRASSAGSWGRGATTRLYCQKHRRVETQVGARDRSTLRRAVRMPLARASIGSTLTSRELGQMLVR
jgi:hypothetical protein